MVTGPGTFVLTKFSGPQLELNLRHHEGGMRTLPLRYTAVIVKGVWTYSDNTLILHIVLSTPAILQKNERV